MLKILFLDNIHIFMCSGIRNAILLTFLSNYSRLHLNLAQYLPITKSTFKLHLKTVASIHWFREKYLYSFPLYTLFQPGKGYQLIRCSPPSPAPHPNYLFIFLFQEQLKKSSKNYTIFYMSEIFPSTLAEIPDIEAWVQIACPRLSIDWGATYHVPLLNPYEASVALKNAEWHKISYPMDFYAYESKGKWTPNYRPPCPCGFTRQTGCKGPRCKSSKPPKENTWGINF